MKIETAYTKEQLAEFLCDIACDIKLGICTQGNIMFSVDSDTGNCNIICIIGNDLQNDLYLL